MEIVPFDGPKSPRNSLTGTEESGLDDPYVKQAVKRPTELSDLKFLDPPVTACMSWYLALVQVQTPQTQLLL